MDPSKALSSIAITSFIYIQYLETSFNCNIRLHIPEQDVPEEGVCAGSVSKIKYIRTRTNTQLQLCLKICSIKICRDKVSDTSMTTRFDTSRKSRLFTSVRSWCFIDPVLYCFSRFHKACGGQRAISQSFPDTSLCIWSEAPNSHVISSYRLLENYIQARTLPD